MKDYRPHEVVGSTFEQGNLGALEDAIYDRMQIRVPIKEEFEPSKDAPDRKRVIIFNVPSRPIGKMLKFEGVPLMRTGESLREMSDAEIFKILSEQEPDFSATDNYQVSLTFRTEIRDVPFLVHIRQEQAKRPQHHKLNVFQLMAIYNVCFGDGIEVRQDVIDGLVEDGLLLRSKLGKVSMAKGYKQLVSEIGHHGDVNSPVNSPVNSLVNSPVNDLMGSLKEVYLIIFNNPGIKIKQLASIRKRAESTIKIQVTKLKKRGHIEYRGSDKTGGYFAK